MNKLFVILGISALAVACGSSTNDTDGGGTDSSTIPDSAKSDGTAGDGSADTGVTDTGTDTGMQDGGGPMDGGFECMDPTTCTGGNTFCCGTIKAGMGQIPACFFSGTYSSKCTMTCATNFTPQCNTTSTRRLCSLKSQCTENTYPECCTVMLMSQAVSICMSAQEAALAQAQCK